MVVPLKDGRVGVARVSLALDPFDVHLLDRMAALQGSNRSEQLRELLEQLRPMMVATVEAFEAAREARERLDLAATQVSIEAIAELMPEAVRMQDLFLGAVAKMEGREASDPRTGNHGGQVPPLSDQASA